MFKCLNYFTRKYDKNIIGQKPNPRKNRQELSIIKIIIHFKILNILDIVFFNISKFQIQKQTQEFKKYVFNFFSYTIYFYIILMKKKFCWNQNCTPVSPFIFTVKYLFE